MNRKESLKRMMDQEKINDRIIRESELRHHGVKGKKATKAADKKKPGFLEKRRIKKKDKVDTKKAKQMRTDYINKINNDYESKKGLDPKKEQARMKEINEYDAKYAHHDGSTEEGAKAYDGAYEMSGKHALDRYKESGNVAWYDDYEAMMGMSVAHRQQYLEMESGLPDDAVNKQVEKLYNDLNKKMAVMSSGVKEPEAITVERFKKELNQSDIHDLIEGQLLKHGIDLSRLGDSDGE